MIIHNTNLDEYMTENVLAYLRVAEGHYDGAKQVRDNKKDIDNKNQKKRTTTYYGLTNSAIAEIKRMYGKELPAELKNVTIGNLKEDEAKEMAYYYAKALTESIQKGMTDDENNSFNNLDVNDRSALLTVYWNTGTRAARQSYAAKSESSLLRGIERGCSKEEMVQLLMANDDGTYLSDPSDDGRNGLRNRFYGAVKYMYDPNAGLDTQEKLDAKRKEWANAKTSSNIIKCTQDIQSWNKIQNENAFTTCRALDIDGYTQATKKHQKNGISAKQKASNDNSDQDGFVTKFTNGLQKFLNIIKGGNDNGGNENNDLQ